MVSKLTIIRIGHPSLRARSVRVLKSDLKNTEFQKFLDNLASICVNNDGAGIAAPQVGVNKRVIVVHVDPTNPRYPHKKAFPLTIVLNPKIISRSKKMKDDWEGDLSSNIRAVVPRPIKCVVQGINREGQIVRYDLDNDFHARVFQHEIDHLNGIFLLDKVKRKETITEYKEWKKYWKGKKI